MAIDVDRQSQLRIGAHQLWLSAAQMPFPAGTWLSVIRRAVIVTAFLVVGFVSGDITVGVGAAFGALQMGLMEGALPGRRLAWLLVINVVVLSGVAFIASSLGGTWWVVALLAVIAYIQGSTGGAGVIPGNTAIGALSIAVLFAAVPRGPGLALTAATWVAIGAAAQAIGWAVMWKLDRRLNLRRAMANAVREVIRMVEIEDRRLMTVASGASDHMRGMLDGSGIVGERYEKSRELIDAIGEVRRSAVAWLLLAEPGFAERHSVADRLGSVISVLDDVSPKRKGRTGSPLPNPDNWECIDSLIGDIDALNMATARYAEPDAGPGSQAGLDKAAAAKDPHELKATFAWLRPGSKGFRHGMRMGLAIGVAQALTLLAGIPHSFWVTITVVFVLKSDWSTTAVRSVGRVIGNLMAVTLVPLALTLTLGYAWAIAIVVFLLAFVMYRYFTGNYIWACLGLAGTVLALDEQLVSNPDLYPARILATLVGIVVAIVASLLIPTWASTAAPSAIRDAVGSLSGWFGSIVAIASPQPAGHSRQQNHTALEASERARSALIKLRSVAEGALVEPRQRRDALLIMQALDSAERVDVGMLAISSLQLSATNPSTLMAQTDADVLIARLNQACATVGVPALDIANPFDGQRELASDEQVALVGQVLRVQEAATSLAEACQELANEGYLELAQESDSRSR